MTNREYFKKNKTSFSEVMKLYEKWLAKNTSTIGNRIENWLSLQYRGKSNVTLLHTPIFDVIEGKEVEAGFKPVKVVAPDWVSVIVENDGKFLMVQQKRYGTDCIVEEFPCGMVEKDETAIGAAYRELLEETGLDVKESLIDDLGSYSPNPAFMTNKMHYFYVKLDGNVEIKHRKQKLDEHEHIKYLWKDRDEVLAESCEDTSKKPALLAAALWKLEHNSNVKRQ